MQFLSAFWIGLRELLPGHGNDSKIVVLSSTNMFEAIEMMPAMKQCHNGLINVYSCGTDMKMAEDSEKGDFSENNEESDNL